MVTTANLIVRKRRANPAVTRQQGGQRHHGKGERYFVAEFHAVFCGAVSVKAGGLPAAECERLPAKRKLHISHLFVAKRA